MRRLLTSDIREERAADKAKAEAAAALLSQAEEERRNRSLQEKLTQVSIPISTDAPAAVNTITEAAMAAVSCLNGESSLGDIADIANHDCGPAVSFVNDLGPFEAGNFNDLDSTNLSTHADMPISPYFAKNSDDEDCQSPQGAVTFVGDS